jgi:hypothetical protein
MKAIMSSFVVVRSSGEDDIEKKLLQRALYDVWGEGASGAESKEFGDPTLIYVR